MKPTVYEQVPTWVAALPFLATIVILVLGQIASNVVSAQFEDYVENEKLRAKAINEKAREQLDEIYPSRLDGSELARVLERSIDTFAASTVFIVPAVGIVIVYFAERTSTLLLFLLAVSALSVGLTLMMIIVKPGRYRRLAWTVFGLCGKRPVSFVTWLGVALNIAAALITWATAPDTATVLHGHLIK